MSSILICPWPVGSVLQLTNGTDPNALYAGTTWRKLEGAFLLASDASHALGTTGGSETVTLTVDQIPGHTHTVGAHAHGLNSHTHSVGAHAHGLNSHTHTYAKPNTPTGGTSVSKAQLPSGITGNFVMSKWGDGSWKVAPSVSGVFTESTPSGSWDRLAYGGSSVSGQQINFDLGGSGNSHTHTIGTTSTNTGGASGSTANSTAFNTGAASGNTANSTAFDSGSRGGWLSQQHATVSRRQHVGAHGVAA